MSDPDKEPEDEHETIPNEKYRRSNLYMDASVLEGPFLRLLLLLPLLCPPHSPLGRSNYVRKWNHRPCLRSSEDRVLLLHLLLCIHRVLRNSIVDSSEGLSPLPLDGESV